MNVWLKKKGIRRCVYHYQGSASFEGNQAEKLLKNVDSLEQAVMSQTGQDTIIKAMPFIQVMRLFKKVVDACFGQALHNSYPTCINDFMVAYRSLGISIPLKVVLDIVIKLFMTRFLV